MDIILDSAGFNQAVEKICSEILRDNPSLDNLAVVGMHTKGVFLSKRITEALSKRLKKPSLQFPFGTIDITLYRDDIDDLGLDIPLIKDTEIPFDLNKKNILLVDDVLFTGRTVRAALDILISFGRPKTIKLAVLIDRGNREFPIEANYVGFKYPSAKKIKVECKEIEKVDRVIVL
ncbi:MAG: bifunctional pyr operon transcriptional regulator/uracil phosphoribosyltransferase PyrR [Elusimicrobiota bacterium]|jgi:pyrimidine operon attenuation protein/uracil phosphoribosyltransferase|nr:bifunctional pyr operon transcriptional regulator/uracil phosphoribosyltransferase PyrR [Elusimicrobiota bacterium]